MAPSDPTAAAIERFDRLTGMSWEDVTAKAESLSITERKRFLHPLVDRMDSGRAIHLNETQRELVKHLIDATLADEFGAFERKYSDGTPQSVARLLSSDEIQTRFLTAVTDRFMRCLAALKTAELPAAAGVYVNYRLWQPMFLESVERVLMAKETQP